MQTKYLVTYDDFSGKRQEAEVKVDSTTDQFGLAYYATSLAKMGCGKNDRDPIGAVHRLVQDHGQVIAIYPLEI